MAYDQTLTSFFIIPFLPVPLLSVPLLADQHSLKPDFKPALTDPQGYTTSPELANTLLRAALMNFQNFLRASDCSS